MYFGTIINDFNDLLTQKRKFYFSSYGLEALQGEWWDEHKNDIIGHKIVCAAFTDYSSDFIDTLVYRKAKEIDDANGAAATEEVWNNARGYAKPYVMGGNAIIFGELADEMCEDTSDVYRWYAPLGDLDDDMTRLEDEYINRDIDGIVKEDIGELTEEERQFVYEWIAEHGRLMPTEMDYSFSDLEEALDDFRGKVKEDPRQQKFDFDKDYLDNPNNQKRKNESSDDTSKDPYEDVRDIIKELLEGVKNGGKVSEDTIQKAENIVYMR